MDRKEYAIQLHKKGYNCAQSVTCAYAEALGYDPTTVFKVSEAFGGGMGTFSTCGAVSAMAVVIGMNDSDGNLDSPKSKQVTYALMREATNKFLAQNKSTICRELKGMETGQILRSCDGCIQDAVAILDELLLGKEDSKSTI